MANTFKPAGLVPVQYLNGAPWNGGGRMYHIDSTDNNAFAIGDPVVLAGGADAFGVPTVTLATAGTANPVLGPMVSGAGAQAWGQQYGVPADAPIVIPATKTRDYYIEVCDDPNVIFQISEANSGTPLAAADVGLNANLLAGTNNGFISGWTVNNSGETTTATLQLKLLGLAGPWQSGNEFGLAAQWLVLINNHCYRVGQAGL